jgi:hypothetical protein
MLTPDVKIRNLHRSLIGRRLHPGPKLPFSRSNYGPHTWCEALGSAQIMASHLPAVVLGGYVGQPWVSTRSRGDRTRQAPKTLRHLPQLLYCQGEAATPAIILKAFTALLRRVTVGCCNIS